MPTEGERTQGFVYGVPVTIIKRGGYLYDYVECPACNRQFMLGKGYSPGKGLFGHISAHTRNSDVAHARLYIAMMTHRNKREEAMLKIRGWIQRHTASLISLVQLGNEKEAAG